MPDAQSQFTYVDPRTLFIGDGGHTPSGVISCIVSAGAIAGGAIALMSPASGATTEYLAQGNAAGQLASAFNDINECGSQLLTWSDQIVCAIDNTDPTCALDTIGTVGNYLGPSDNNSVQDMQLSEPSVNIGYEGDGFQWGNDIPYDPMSQGGADMTPNDWWDGQSFQPPGPGTWSSGGGGTNFSSVYHGVEQHAIFVAHA